MQPKQGPTWKGTSLFLTFFFLGAAAASDAAAAAPLAPASSMGTSPAAGAASAAGAAAGAAGCGQGGTETLSAPEPHGRHRKGCYPLLVL